jgi:hypothetical protein
MIYFKTKKEAKAWIDARNNFLIKHDDLCCKYEGRLLKSQNPVSQQLARSIYRFGKKFRDFMQREMDRVAKEFDIGRGRK